MAEESQARVDAIGQHRVEPLSPTEESRARVEAIGQLGFKQYASIEELLARFDTIIEDPFGGPIETAVDIVATRQSCLGLTPAADIDNVDTIGQWLAGQGAQTAIEKQVGQRVVNYKVYLPALESREAADAQIARMRAAGLTDLLPIAGGDLANGIAAGVYGTQSAAARRVAALTELGFSSASRPRYREQDIFDVRILIDPDDASIVTNLPDRFPGYELLTVDCP